MEWADSILNLLGVHQITWIKEVWVVGTLMVFIMQIRVGGGYLRKPLYSAFGLYLWLAGLRDLAHYFGWWTWKWEAFASGIAALAAMEAAVRVTWCVREYQRSYTRHGIFIMAITAVAWAAFQVPEPYPGFDQGVYYIRLYMNTFCLFTVLVALICVWRNWNARTLGMMETRHAMVLAVWFGCFVWEDRLMVRGEAWFPPAIAQVVIQGMGLVMWWRMGRDQGSRKATFVSITGGRSQFDPG